MENYKYLIRIPNHLGDSIMALPAVKAFLSSKQNDNTALLLPEWAKPVYRNLKTKFLLAPSDKLHGLTAITFQTKLLRKYKIDNGILLTPSFSSALIMFIGGIKNRYGYTDDNQNFLLNKSISLPKGEIQHRSEKYKLLLEKTANNNLKISAPKITVPDSHKFDTSKLLNKSRIDNNQKYIVIAPQAIAESRRWGTDNYSTLAHKIVQNYDFKIILVGTSDQYETAQKIVKNEQKILNLCGQTNIEQAASVLAGAKLFIGNDSGLAHLASAVDIPLLILSGADNPKETSPISNKKTVIIKENLECISCVKNVCTKSDTEFMLCMKQISVNEVLAAISESIFTEK
ncbi:MAG: lipopolysaccharide heptosyltransferase II [candidate division Zixibacteria bacterium]|nr:lipopolysaccharide heptosyltransferase II [candidate division Zixibacteria bacterium]